MYFWIASAAAYLAACAAVQALSAERKLRLALSVAKWSALVWVGVRACAFAYGIASA